VYILNKAGRIRRRYSRMRLFLAVVALQSPLERGRGEFQKATIGGLQQVITMAILGHDKDFK
jgi:hypothetical protein